MFRYLASISHLSNSKEPHQLNFEHLERLVYDEDSQIIDFMVDVEIINMDALFAKLAFKGKLKPMKQIYDLWKQNKLLECGSCVKLDLNYAFYQACVSGKLEVAKWLVGLKPSVAHNLSTYQFDDICYESSLDMLLYLYLVQVEGGEEYGPRVRMF